MKRVMLLLVVVTSVSVASTAWAVSASFFEAKTAADCRKGTLDGVVVSEPGRLTLSFEKKELMKAEGEVIWSLAVHPTGTIYATTGHKGKVRTIKGGKAAEVAATLDDAALFASAIGPDGKVYVGGSPSGTIYKDWKVFCKTGQSYIWSMLFDKAGNLYAATGPDGKLLKINPAGVVTTVLDSSDQHLMSLVRDSKGNIYAGSSSKGLIYRLSVDGSTKVIYDASEGEIRCLAVDDSDRLYFGTADVKSGGGSGGPVGMRSARPVSSSGASRTSTKSTSGSAPPKTPSASVRDDVSATNAIYRIDSTGSVLKLYSIRGKMIMSLLWLKGDLFAGTGNRGDLVRIDGNLDVTLIEKDLEKQVLCLAKGPAGEVLMGTGDHGKVLSSSGTYIKEGLYTSSVFDAKFPAKFGAISWTGRFPAGTSVEVTTQTGNVAEPDASWSDWSAAYPTSGSNVTSPGARFIRYRLRLKTLIKDSTPEVDELKLAYLTSNQPPRVTDVKVLVPADAKNPPAKPKTPGKVDVSWQAKDPNNDKMHFKLEFRKRGDENWRLLEEKLEKPTYSWLTTDVPDAIYEVRVTASDSPANTLDRALSHHATSKPFVVDNGRPNAAVVLTPGADSRFKVTLMDSSSIIKSAEYSIDSEEWRRILPDDGIFDAKLEKATIVVKDLKKGEHTIVVRVVDEQGNSGAGSLSFKKN